MMTLTIFAKKRKTKDGKEFPIFITRMTKKDGSELVANIQFVDCDKPKPNACPLNIDVEKTDANLTCRTVTTDDGNVYENNTLWVKAYSESKEAYVDHSLDEF